MEEFQISLDTYHEYMCEALLSLNAGLRFNQEASLSKDDVLQRNELLFASGMQCRYAFLLGSNALEAAANAILLGLESSRTLYEDLERLQTLLKFEVFCLAHGKKLDRSNALYGRVIEVVKCRNEFVHPKPKKASITRMGTDLEILVSRTKMRNYPTSFSQFNPNNALEAIRDIVAFISWIVFDICGFNIEDGSMLLGFGSCSSTGDVALLSKKYGFDVRSFGKH